jgi:5'/3'-nucleotidase
MHRARVVLSVLLALGLLAPPLGVRAQAPPPYRILISNDDGVHAPGIAALAQTLQAIGDVTIVAPAENFSGAGHSIVTTAPVFREDLTLPNGLKAIGLTATPASTVDVALRNIMTTPPDLVVTGINRGYNLGLSIYVSGTNGAAREAAFRGIPAIATSIEVTASSRELGTAAEEVLGVARRVKQHGLPKYSFLNVNVPPRPEGGYKGYMVTTAASIKGGQESFAEVKRPATNQTVYWDVFTPENLAAPQGTDIWAVSNGYVSVTPLKVGETDPTQLDALRGWFK